jgi:hypothetical protein
MLKTLIFILTAIVVYISLLVIAVKNRPTTEEILRER